MTTPYVPEPNGPQWQTAQQPTVRQRRIRTTKIVLLSVVAMMVLCVGGLATLGAIIGDPKAKDAASTSGTPNSFVEAPSVAPTTEEAAPVEKPSPTVAPTTVKAQPKPAVTHRVVPKPKPATKKPKPKPTKTTPSTKKGVHPGAFCSPGGALGHTSKGTLMRCTLKAGEDRARWRKA